MDHISENIMAKMVRPAYGWVLYRSQQYAAINTTMPYEFSANAETQYKPIRRCWSIEANVNVPRRIAKDQSRWYSQDIAGELFDL